MGELKIFDVQNVDIGRRSIVVSPPEPPAEYLMADPKNSIYIGRTAVFSVPFHWTFQRLTNPHIAITGITGSGKSIVNCRTLIRRKGKVQSVLINDLVNDLIAENEKETIDDCEGVSDPGIEVYAFDDDLRGKWSAVRFAGRKNADEFNYKIITASGREIITTKDHNMVVLRDGAFFAAKTTETSIGDYIPLPRTIQQNDTNLDTLAYPLTPELMRLFGYLVSEGLLYKHREMRIFNTDENVLRDIELCMRFFGTPLKLVKDGRTVGLRLVNRALVKFFEEQGCGENSGTKRAPSMLFSMSNTLLSQYLKAYYEGDGCAEKNSITAVTKSKDLADDHLYLLLRFGIVGRVSRTFKRATNSPNHKGDWYHQITISGREQISKFAQICFVSEKKNRKLHGLLEKKGDTNVDIIPGISGVVKKIYDVLKFDRTQMSYSIIAELRNPSRVYLSHLMSKISARISEIKCLSEDIDQLRMIPQLSEMVQLASTDKVANGQLYKQLDETWRRAKQHTVNTKLSNARKIAGTVDKALPADRELKSIIQRTFTTLNIGIQTYDQSVYDFCTGRHTDITYQKLEGAARFIIGKYDELSFDVKNLEKDIEFLQLLSNSDLFWDPIVSIEKVKSDHPYVYDLCVDDEVFLAGFGGMFVHNSYLIKTFLLRAALVWNANAVIIDWAGEYKSWVKQVNGVVVALGKGSYMNLLDLGGMKPSDRIKQIIRSLEILTDIGQYPEQRRLIEEAIEKTYLKIGFRLAEKDQKDALGNTLRPPTLKDVHKTLQQTLDEGSYEFPAELQNAIYKIRKFTMEGDDYFAEQSTIDLDKLLTSGLVSIDLSGLPDETFRALGALTILQFIKEKMRFEGWKPDKGVKLWVVLDEAWKISRDENSDAVMIVREGRKYQFGLIVASQTPTDISEVIFSNVGTVIMLRLKFEKYLDYLQTSLRFSNYIRQQILGFGMGQAAVSMAYEQSVPFSETFILKKIDGEEPIIDYFLDIASVLTEAQRRDDTMPKSYSMERTAFKKRIREMGISEDKVEELATMIEKKAKHFDAVEFVIELERRGVTRKIITVFFRELGIDDSTIINIFTRADQKKTGLTERDISQVTLE